MHTVYTNYVACLSLILDLVNLCGIQKGRIFIEIEIARHVDRVVHVLVHRSVPHKSVSGNQKARREERPPKDRREKPDQDEDRYNTHAKRRSLLRNVNACRN